jgi:predicted metal-dependent hydrolase
VQNRSAVVDGFSRARASPPRPSEPAISVARVTVPLPGMGPEIEVRRSARRRRTVSAYRDGERVVVLIPARFTKSEEQEWVTRMVARVLATPARRRGGDAELARRARELSDRYLDGLARPISVRWVAAMRTRWASCTPAERTIRLSRALLEMPSWVQDYVLLHELAHLIESGHGPRFWRLLERYPRTERARGYLDGVSAAAHLPIADDLEEDESDEDVADAG